jgi:hypothetical protein
MQPGAKVFLEGLADFILKKLWWKVKSEAASGDVPILIENIRKKAHMFSNIEITGDKLFF